MILGFVIFCIFVICYLLFVICCLLFVYVLFVICYFDIINYGGYALII